MVPADVMPQTGLEIRMPGLYRVTATNHLRAPATLGSHWAAGERYGFRRRTLDAAGFGFYIPPTFGGNAKQLGVVAEQRRHLLLDISWDLSHIDLS
jgi:hypothetical protein